MRCSFSLLCPTLSRLSGTVIAWHPFERRGRIRCDGNGHEYTIPNARAFETILPTHMSDLVGSRVSFDALCDPQEVNRVRTRSRLDPITSHTYTNSPKCAMSTPTRAESSRVAGNITVDAAFVLKANAVCVRPAMPLKDLRFAAPSPPPAWDGRVVLEAHCLGVVRAWSARHRSGVVAFGDDVCLIRNAHAFETALPTAHDLVGCAVRFARVTYPTEPNRVFAENILVDTPPETKPTSANTTHTAKEAAERLAARRARQLGTLFDETDAAEETETETATERFGVVTRWSGGHGVIETGGHKVYYVESGADFVQLVDQSSHALRGAVVRFRVDANDRRHARRVEVLSMATRDDARGATRTETPMDVSTRPSPPPMDADWRDGMLLLWSPVERQGVIHGDDGGRYVLRDAEEAVKDFTTQKALLTKGRRVRFVPSGANGRVAVHVTLLETEADAAALAEAELRPQEPRLSMDGHTEEAIASPMSTSYWIARMDRAGYDTAEVKKMQNKAITFDDEDEEEEKLLDSEELFKKDHWFNDPRKNKKLPNSDVTSGNLALIGPASMMNIAMKAHDPKKLEKMKNKYYNRLTEPMKEYAWKQAKELAPKYEKRIKEAREKGEEPRFSFY